MSNYLNVLYIFCEAVTEGSVLSFVRTLGKKGVLIYIYLLGDPKGLKGVYASSRYCRKVIVVSQDNYKEKLAEHHYVSVAAPDSAKTILLPFTDQTAALVAENWRFFTDRFDVMQADPQIIRAMLDKEEANVLAQKCGLSVPASMTISTPQSLSVAPKVLGLPIILKPTWFKTNHSADFKAVIVKNEAELITAGKALLEDGTTIMAQEFIAGDDNCVEFFLFYRERNGNLYSCSGKKDFQFPKGRGILAVGHTEEDNFLEKLCRDFLQDLDYVGFGGVEFKRCNEKLFFIEMSVRPEAFSHIAISSGLNLPWFGYLSHLGAKKMVPAVRNKVAYYFNPFCCWRILTTAGIKEFSRLLRLIFVNKASTDIICRDDMKPFIKLILVMIKRKLASFFL